MTPSTLQHGRRGVRFRRLALGLACAIATAAGAAPAAGAVAAPPVIVKVQRASGFVSPYFALGARPGSSARAGAIEVINPHAHRVVVRVAPVSGMTTSTLGSAYQQEAAPLTGAARWIAVSTGLVTLPPHGHQDVSVGLRVPRGAAPGDYLGGVSVEALGQDHVTKSRGVAIGQIQRYAIGVEVSLPGVRRRHITLTGAALRRDPSGLAFEVLGRNDGNAILQGVRGNILVTRGSKRVATVPVTPGTFVSGTAIAYPARAVHEQPREGTRYRVRATFYYPGSVAHLDTRVTFGHSAAVTQQRYGGPRVDSGTDLGWIAALVAIVAIALAAVALWRRRRGLPGREEALALVRAELEHPHAARRPVSVLAVAVNGVPSAQRRRLTRELDARLRRSDRIFDLAQDGLLVVLPDTSATMAEELACDAIVAVMRAELASAVRGVSTATASPGSRAADAIARAVAGSREVPAPA